MRSNKFQRPSRWLVAAAAIAALLGGASAAPSYAATRHRHRPTVVLVHGAWADSSSWDGVVRRLQRDGYPVEVFATPLRSLSGDAGALRDVLCSIPGPVVLVGHSYGGAVVTNAATDNVRALVYVDAFAPAEGQPVLALPGTGSALVAADPTAVFRFVPGTLPPTADTDLYVLPNVFVSSFANDLPRRRAQVLAVTQRPVTYGALSAPSGPPAWRPSRPGTRSERWTRSSLPRPSGRWQRQPERTSVLREPATCQCSRHRGLSRG